MGPVNLRHLTPQRSRVTVVILSLAIGAVMMAIVLGVSSRSSLASAGTLCVKPGGGDGCEATISAALALAQANDTIRVATGVYHENVLISQTVNLQGGWALDFSLRDLDTFSSTITPADNTQSVVAIQGDFADPTAVAPTLDGFVITGGRADLGSNHGGGLRIIDSHARVISNTIRDNSAFLLGGGVWVQRGAPLLQGNQIMDNQSLGLGQEARGGGVQLEVSGATLISNTIAANLAEGLMAQGGGVDIISAPGISVTLGGNAIRYNVTDASQPGNGFGGGVAISGAGTGLAILTNNQVFSNTAAIDLSGQPQSLGFGGGIYFGSGRLQLSGSGVISNTAGMGGGIFIGGITDGCCQFSSTQTLVQYNRAESGGGLYIDGQIALMRDGLVFSNTAAAGGGGIFISAGASFSLTNSATIANLAGGDGGGIYNAGVFSVTNTTLSGNTAAGMGGGVANVNLVDLVNATISDNDSAGGAGVFNASMVNAVNSLIALNDGDNCLGVMNSFGHNLEDGFTCALGQPTDMPNTPPSMESLGNNGGSTPTHALESDSPAIDAGDNAACETVDQRGVPRPLDGDGDGQAVCDIGAYEYGGVFPWLHLPIVVKE